MAINHEWQITRMDVWKEFDGKENIVCNVFFAVVTTDSDHPVNSVTQNGAVAVPFNPKNDVTPYEELTLEQVTQWVKDELKIYQQDETGMFVLDADGNRIEVGDQVPDILASGEKQLQDLINPPIISKDLPWIKGQ